MNRVEASVLQTATFCLVAAGVLMVFSASSTTSLLGEIGDGTYYLKRTLLFGVIGLIAMRVLSGRGLRAIHTLTPIFLIGSIALLVLVLLPGFGLEANGARRWIGAGPIQVQPSELAKLALILYGAKLLAARPLDRDRGALLPVALVGAAVCLLIVIEPDLGSALVAVFALAALLVAAGVPLRILAGTALALVAVAAVAIMIEPYRQERLTGFLNPGADASGAGFQGIQASIALGSGGIFGTGLGESVQKASYLPEAHTDMIAAVIGEELGLIGIAAMITLYGAFAYAGLRIAQRARDRYGQLLVAGLTSLVLVQATVNLFAVMGLAPLTGVPLPFVSYGNSSLIVSLAAVGLMLNVAGGGTVGGRKGATGRAARARLKVVDGGRGRPPAKRSKRAQPTSRRKSRETGRNSSGRDSRARRAGARRRRRA